MDSNKFPSHLQMTPGQTACGRAIHDQCMMLFAEHGLTALEGLTVMQSLMGQFVVFVRDQLLVQDITLPDRFLWQCMAEITMLLPMRRSPCLKGVMRGYILSQRGLRDLL